ncbi:MAG: hypothetical protein ACP5FQ_07255 [Thermoplasmata archaeon]
MKICHFCLKSNKDDSDFCTYCGANFKKTESLISQIIGGEINIPFTQFPILAFEPIDKVTPNPCYSKIFTGLENTIYGLWVYIYEVNPDMISREGNRVTKVIVNGYPSIFFPRLYNLSVTSNNGRINFTFTRKKIGESFLLLSFLKSTDNSETYGIYLIDSSFLVDDRKKLILALKMAAKRFGMPLLTKKVKFTLNFNSESESEKGVNKSQVNSFASAKEDAEVFEEALPLYLKMMKDYKGHLNVPSEDSFGIIEGDSPYNGWYYVTPLFYRRFFLRDHANISFKTLESMAKNYPADYYGEHYIPNLGKILHCLIIPKNEYFKMNIDGKLEKEGTENKE